MSTVADILTVLPDKVLPEDFEQLADEAGLAKPMVKRRVVELAETVLSKIPELAAENPPANPVPELVRSRCTTVMNRFTR